MRQNTNSGILCLNKPRGITSHDAVNRIRRLYGTKKVGHTGTLDPMATGVLLILVGNAVKASEYLLCEDKEYTASLILGKVSDTLDITGKVEDTALLPLPSEKELVEILPLFLGEISQLPPMYSAIKKDGKKLYELAREGKSVEREPRTVTISDIKYLGRGDAENEYKIKVCCSKGTYIRSLCADIGEKLGCGAVMSSLCRDKSSHFLLDNSYTPDEIEKMDEKQRRACLISVEEAFSDLDSVSLPPFFEKLARCGNEIYLKKLNLDFKEDTMVRLSGARGFFALGKVKGFPDGLAIKPVKQFDTENT